MTILQYLIEKKDKKDIHLHIQGKNQSDINVNMDRMDTEIWICECVWGLSIGLNYPVSKGQILITNSKNIISIWLANPIAVNSLACWKVTWFHLSPWMLGKFRCSENCSNWNLQSWLRSTCWTRFLTRASVDLLQSSAQEACSVPEIQHHSLRLLSVISLGNTQFVISSLLEHFLQNCIKWHGSEPLRRTSRAEASLTLPTALITVADRTRWRFLFGRPRWQREDWLYSVTVYIIPA